MYHVKPAVCANDTREQHHNQFSGSNGSPPYVRAQSLATPGRGHAAAFSPLCNMWRSKFSLTNFWLGLHRFNVGKGEDFTAFCPTAFLKLSTTATSRLIVSHAFEKARLSPRGNVEGSPAIRVLFLMTSPCGYVDVYTKVVSSECCSVNGKSQSNAPTQISRFPFALSNTVFIREKRPRSSVSHRTPPGKQASCNSFRHGINGLQ